MPNEGASAPSPFFFQGSQMSECVVKIERLANGYEVEMTDPKIVKENSKIDRKGPWRDPKVAYAFKSVEEVLNFLKTNLDTAMPMDDYETSFDAAAANEEED